MTDHTPEALADRMFGALLGLLDVHAAYLGDRLGWYRALAAGPRTSTELAGDTGTAERYAREWLEHQAVGGVLTVDDPAAEPAARRYTLPAGHVGPLTDELSPLHLLPVARLLVGLGRRTDALLAACRTGGGLAWAEHDPDVAAGQAGANRPLFLGALAREHLPSIPEVDAALRAGGRVVDVGCGHGWSAIGIALAYPDATVDGVDVDAPSVAAARENAVAAGVADRVRFHIADARTAPLADGGYDLVAAFECVHDLPDPVGVLARMRALAAPGGTVLVMDERVAETFTAPGDEIERLMYGYSLLCCLPDGLAHPASAATGTVMRPDTLRGYAREAGFADVATLPVEDAVFRFYRLR